MRPLNPPLASPAVQLAARTPEGFFSPGCTSPKRTHGDDASKKCAVQYGLGVWVRTLYLQQPYAAAVVFEERQMGLRKRAATCPGLPPWTMSLSLRLRLALTLGNARAHRAPHRALPGTYPTRYLPLGPQLRHSGGRYLGR